MGFKERILEENFLEKTGNFIKQHPILSAGLGGTAAGMAYNYFSDGADNLANERTADLKNWMNNDAKNIMMNKELLDKDTFTDARDNWMHAAGKADGWSYLSGKTEDMHPFMDKAAHQAELQKMAAHNPYIALDNGKAVVNGDYQFNPEATSDNDYDKYRASLNSKFKNMSGDEFADRFNKDQNLVRELKDQQSSINHSTGDSYFHKALGGAALGAGSAYAAKKYREKKENGM
jgi:hypothetical protein